MNILIIHTAFIGDIALSTPFIQELKDKYPNSKIYYLTTPVSATLLKNDINIEKVFAYDKKNNDKGIVGFFKIVKMLKEYKFDKCYLVHKYFRSALIPFLLGVKERIGYDTSKAKFLYTKIIKYKKELHEVERVLELEKIENKKYKINIFVGDEEKKNIDKIWQENNLYNKNIITIAPGSRWFTKMWPNSYFDELILCLNKVKKEMNIEIILIGGKEDKEIEIKNEKMTLDLRGKTSLLEMSEILSRSTIILSNDSSPIHIGSAFEKPFILGIFGPTEKSLGFTPYNEKHKIIEIKDLNCRPCGLHGGNSCPEKHFKCMLNLTPQIVYSEVINVLKMNNE